MKHFRAVFKRIQYLIDYDYKNYSLNEYTAKSLLTFQIKTLLRKKRKAKSKLFPLKKKVLISQSKIK